MSSSNSETSEMNIDSESTIVKAPEIKYGIKESLRATKYELDALNSEIRFILRKTFRELRVLMNPVELFYLFFLLGLGLLSFFVFTVVIIPVLLWTIPGVSHIDIWGKPPFIDDKGLYNTIIGIWLSSDTLRLLGVGAGGIGVLIRLLFRPDIDKFKDKVNSRSEITYVFGSTIYAEKLIEKLVFQFAYEEQAALIADKKYLWVERLAGSLDTYTVHDTEEFEKRNLYEIIGFKNAKRALILTDNIERNQNILTNLRAIRPDLPIYILSQYTPQYLKSGELVQDDYLHIIDDLENTREALVKSLSLNINFPDCIEINVPRNYVGLPVTRFSQDKKTFDLEILAIRRPNIDDDGWQLIPSEDGILQRTDRIIIHAKGSPISIFGLKQTNRTVSELPVRHLVDLGELKIEQNGKRVTAKVTDAPGRSLLIEPKGTRKSWRRRLLGGASLITLIISLFLGRNEPVELFTYVMFFAGIIGLLIAHWLHPLPERGIMIWSKHDKTFLKRTKAFSKFGEDINFSFEKATHLIVRIDDKDTKLLTKREYILADQEGNYIQCLTLFDTGAESRIVIKRFEIRLQAYSNLKITETSKEIDVIIKNIMEDAKANSGDQISSKTIIKTSSDQITISSESKLIESAEE